MILPAFQITRQANQRLTNHEEMVGEIMSAWDIYWLTRLDAIQITLVVLAIVSSIVGLVTALIITMEEIWDGYGRKLFIWCSVIFGISILILTIIPSSKEMAAIYLIPKIVNDEKVAQVPDKALQILNGKLDEWLDEMRGKDKK